MTSTTFPWPIAEHRLANGLRIAVVTDTIAPVVAVSLTYRVGSRDDPAELPGLAHLLGHLVCEGAGQVGRGRHNALLDTAGAQGLDVTTTFDRTAYHQTVPSGAWDLALQLEARRMAGPEWSEGLLADQLAAVRHEDRQLYAAAPFGRWRHLALACLYPDGHPYAHPPVGATERLTSVDLATVEAFHRQTCVPRRAVLAVVGAVRPEEVFARAEEYFGGIPAGPEPAAPGRETEAVSPPRRIELARREPRSETGRVYLAHRIPAAPGPDHDTLTLLAAVLSRGRPAAPAGDRTACAWDLAHGSSVFTLGLSAGQDVSTSVLARAVESELADVAAGRLDRTELAHARTQLRADWLRSLAPFGVRACELARHVDLFGAATAIADAPARLGSVTTDDLVRVTRQHLCPDRRLVLRFDGTAR